MFIHRFGTLAHLLAYTEIREKKKQIDYSSLVAQLIREKSKRNRRRRRKHSKKTLNKIPDSNLTTDDEEYKTDDDGKGSLKSSDTDDVKPSDYGNVFGEVIQKLKSGKFILIIKIFNLNCLFNMISFDRSITNRKNSENYT